MKKWGIWVLSLAFVFTLKAQHAFYSSLNQNLLSMNPAFAGTNGKLRTQAIAGRTDWAKYGEDQQAYYAGVDMRLKKYSAIGLSFNSQTFYNSFRTMQADFSYALHFRIRNINLVPAIQLSFFQYKLNRAWISYLYPISSGGTDDLTLSNLYVYKFNYDLSSGLLIYGKRFYAGVNLMSFTQPDEGIVSFSKRPFTQIYQGRYRLISLEKMRIDAYVFGKVQNNPKSFHALDFSNPNNFIQYGVVFNYSVLQLHIAHRINNISNYDAFISGIAINTKSGFKIGFNNRCNYGTRQSNVFFNEFYIQFSLGKIKKDPEEKDTSIRLID